MKRTLWCVMTAWGLLLAMVLAVPAEEPDYRRIETAGKEYTYNERITTILYATAATDGELTTEDRCGTVPRVDTVELVILDHYHKKISLLSISGDTFASVGRYTEDGSAQGNRETQLGNAYAYGDGGKLSCRNLRDAVSDLLGGIPIHEYVVASAGSIDRINELAGGITVTVPNNDLAKQYPELTKGSTVKLDRRNIKEFLCWQNAQGQSAGKGRMERQQAYCKAFLTAFRQQAADQPETLWKKVRSLGGAMQTSITRAQYLKLAEELAADTFSEADTYALEGTDGDTRNGMRLDPEETQETVLKLFYLTDEESVLPK